jgi:hypothetical protein
MIRSAFIFGAVVFMTRIPVEMSAQDKSGAPVYCDVDSLRAHVRFLTDITPPRTAFSDSSLAKAYIYIEQQFQQIGLHTSRQVFSAGREYVNIIGTLNPQKGKTLVIGAHYDVCGEQSGADDNASGVAGMIEIARELFARRDSIDYQIQFVGYANEEPPFFGTARMGSHVHAQSLKKAREDVRLMIALEMIGYFSDEKKSQKYPTILLAPFYPSRGNFIAAVSNFKSRRYLKQIKRVFMTHNLLSCETLAAPGFVKGIGFSDHRSFQRFGFEALMITDTAFFRNRNYHEPGDTIETLDFERMSQVVQGVALFLLSNPI